MSETGLSHELKTWPAFYCAIKEGRKKYEIRKNDKGFAVGDRIRLNEYDPASGYTGQFLDVKVTYMTEGGSWGLPEDICVLSIEPVAPKPQEERSEMENIKTEPYIVVANGDDACAHCNAGTMWDILYVPEDIRMGTSYGDQQNAEDICELLNLAFENGLEQAKARPAALHESTPKEK